MEYPERIPHRRRDRLCLHYPRLPDFYEQQSSFRVRVWRGVSSSQDEEVRFPLRILFRWQRVLPNPRHNIPSPPSREQRARNKRWRYRAGADRCWQLGRKADGRREEVHRGDDDRTRFHPPGGLRSRVVCSKQRRNDRGYLRALRNRLWNLHTRVRALGPKVLRRGPLRHNLRGSTDKLWDRRVYRPGLRRNLSLIFARVSSRLPASSSCELGSGGPPAYRGQEEEPLGIRDRVFFDLSCIAKS